MTRELCGLPDKPDMVSHLMQWYTLQGCSDKTIDNFLVLAMLRDHFEFKLQSSAPPFCLPLEVYTASNPGDSPCRSARRAGERFKMPSVDVTRTQRPTKGPRRRPIPTPRMWPALSK